jgi:hypothetical protein
MGWSEKYKKSIDCDNPKGFSQRAHCQGRKKKMTEEKKDHEYSMARSELKTVTNAVKRLQKKMGKKGEGNLQAWVQSKITKAADYIDTAADYVTNEETVKEEGLRDWFGKSKSKDGKSGWVNVVTGGTCASDEPGEGTPKCVSSAKRASMTKAERLSAQRRKKEADPGQQAKTGAAKPTYVSTDPEKKMKKEEVEVTEAKDKPGKGSGKKDACYNKVKSRYDVWPSAYASGALVKCRKVGAANWGNKTESVEFSDWRNDFKAMEYEFIDIIKPEPLVTEGSFDINPEAHRKAQREKKIRDRTKTGDEGSEIAKKKVKGPKLIGEEQLDEAGKKCWKGYKKAGTQTLFGKTYNRCVKEGSSEEKHTPTKSDLESKIGGGNLQKLSKKAAKRIDYDVDGDVDPQDKVEKKTGEYGEQLPTPFGKFRTENPKNVKVKKEQFSDWRTELDEGAAWTKKAGKSESGGLNEKGRKSYERENPGSDLKAPSKKVGNKRRASFCARMSGMKKKLTSAKTANDPDSRINKSLRAWNC